MRNIHTTMEAGADAREFLRTKGVEERFGIKRGTLYNLHEQKKVKGVVLRMSGNLTGVRLWNVQSIQEYLGGLMAEQEQAEQLTTAE